MTQFSADHSGATVKYNWPVNNCVQYRNGEGPHAAAHGPNKVIGADAHELDKTRRAEAGDDRSHREIYQTQMGTPRPNRPARMRQPPHETEPNPNHPANSANRGGHIDPNEHRHERTPSNKPTF
jgi:hypothetical protein